MKTNPFLPLRHEATCQRCGERFQKDASERFKPRYCDPCIPLIEAELASEIAAAKERQERVKRNVDWGKKCPPAFQNTQRDLLPRPELLDRLLDWVFGPRGLLIHGPTRTGKSRCAYELLKREHNKGRSVLILNARFTATINALYAKGTEAVEQFLQSHIKAEILLMEDVFKARLTDHAEATLFNLIEGRLLALRPTIITTNDTAETLAARLSPDRRDPLLQRLREACEDVPVV